MRSVERSPLRTSLGKSAVDEPAYSEGHAVWGHSPGHTIPPSASRSPSTPDQCPLELVRQHEDDYYESQVYWELSVCWALFCVLRLFPHLILPATPRTQYSLHPCLKNKVAGARPGYVTCPASPGQCRRQGPTQVAWSRVHRLNSGLLIGFSSWVKT